MRHAWLMGLWFTLFTLSLHAAHYVDNDLDGVDDRIDRCLHTPFDSLVDENGCPLPDEPTQTAHDSWTLQAGVTRNSDATYDTDTLINFYAAYQTKRWDVSVSSSAYRAQTFTGAVETRNDVYATLGYTIPNEYIPLRLSLGTAFRTDQSNDYYAALDTIYRLDDRWALTGYYAFTLAGTSDELTTQNYHTVSGGIAYMPTQRQYLSLAYNHMTPVYKGGEAYRTLSLYGVYRFGKTMFVSLGYAYGLNDEAYDYSLSVSVGVRFE